MHRIYASAHVAQMSDDPPLRDQAPVCMLLGEAMRTYLARAVIKRTVPITKKGADPKVAPFHVYPNVFLEPNPRVYRFWRHGVYNHNPPHHNESTPRVTT